MNYSQSVRECHFAQIYKEIIMKIQYLPDEYYLWTKLYLYARYLMNIIHRQMKIHTI